MMRILIAFVIFVLNVCVSSAQTYQVYSVKGEIKTAKGVVKQGDKLTGNTAITIPGDGRIVLLSESDKKLFTIKDGGKGNLAEIIKKTTTTSQQLTDSYLAFVKKKILGTDETDKNHMQSAGTSYRETDSLLQNVLIPEEKIDTLKNKVEKK